MPFIPNTPEEEQRVPYYEETLGAKESGWQGQSTSKSFKALKSEVTEALGRLGAVITTFQQGTFDSEQGSRDGFQIKYTVETPDGRQMFGRIDIAALPVDPNINWNRADKSKHRDASLRMSLYMLRIALDGTWFLQQLSPGFSALVPFMLGPGDKTISQLWTDGPMNNLLPPGDTEDFTTIEGESREI